MLKKILYCSIKLSSGLLLFFVEHHEIKIDIIRYYSSSKSMGRTQCDIMVKVLDGSLEVNEFKL